MRRLVTSVMSVHRARMLLSNRAHKREAMCMYVHIEPLRIHRYIRWCPGLTGALQRPSHKRDLQ